MQLTKHIMFDELERIVNSKGKDYITVRPKSPLTEFDLLIFDFRRNDYSREYLHTLFVEPHAFIVSDYHVIDSDNRKGRIILVKKDPAGLKRVNSAMGEEVCLTLADGMELGHKDDVSYYDLFPAEAERKSAI